MPAKGMLACAIAIARSAPLEPARRALLSESGRGFLEVLGQIKPERRGDESRLLDQTVEIPAPRAHRAADAQGRVLRDLPGQLMGDFEMLSGGRDPVEEADGEPFLRRE